jgi:hypothetical protein
LKNAQLGVKSALKIAAAAVIFKIELRLQNGQISPDFAEIRCTDQKTHAEFKKAKVVVYGHFSRWPPPPSGKSMKRCKWVNYHPILLKFSTQTWKNVLSSNITKVGLYGCYSKWPL